VQQNHVAGGACILDNLKRDTGMLLDVPHETGRTLVGIAIGVQSGDIRMSAKQPAIFGAARPGRRRMVLEVLMNQTM